MARANIDPPTRIGRFVVGSEPVVEEPRPQSGFRALKPADGAAHRGDRVTPIPSAVRPVSRAQAPRVRAGWTRVLALFALACIVLSVGEAASAAYHAWQDAFVMPIILSPDSDLVLPSKLSLAQLEGEHQAQAARASEAEQKIEVAERGLAKLAELKHMASNSLTWSDTMTANQSASTATDLRVLTTQRQLMTQHIAEQEAYVQEMQRNLASGLVRKSDLLREKSQLSQMRIAALDNERQRVASSTLHEQQALARAARRERSAQAELATPEMLQQRDQVVRIELEIMRLQAERDARAGELNVAREEAKKLEQLITEMRRRPVFRAIDAAQNVAFIPYAQISHVQVGASVFECRVLGMFSCESVGKVLEVLPGEVNMQDPWGTPARGQYAILDLREPNAARAKALRIRPDISLDWLSLD
jgi:hypothetical protein